MNDNYSDLQYRDELDLINRFIHKLKCLYHQMTPLTKLLELLRSEFPQMFNLNNDLILNQNLQQLIYANVVKDRDRPTKQYCSKFIKLLIEILERYDKEINEELLDLLMSDYVGGGASEHNDDDDDDNDKKEYIYKSYYIDNQKWVTLKNEAIYNLVGMTTWGAAYLLSDFILANKQLFNEKTILELGAGTGLIGLVLDQVNSKSVLLTDYSPVVLDNLKYNIENNGIKIQDLINVEYGDEQLQQNLENGDDTKFKVMTFDWEANLDDKQCEAFQSDIILGADIVYDPSLCKYLVAVLHRLCMKNPSTVAYIASTIRNQQTFSTFQQELQSHNFNITEINYTPDNFVHPSPYIYDYTQIVLYKITLK
ncbi:hypothetical protein PPL_00803 [Heterostelium album PN500]|uniref:Uncharacterized protein n=1 Tax=Heterostelium pallidum (strain ATCC 26659 / Pp 5 / PN500) TaxID=670386 RepID=D3AXH2_HETP5|nr:hypothetical protein PPL_00803 [Heterostelium album PN500]EFA86241.1 hypothetical protein PPL_00803 [Heterostelium album PN500]|eukprot:XP_020438346.1 hypothetical protein PPL_00803 [Heterostelium album PN500]